MTDWDRIELPPHTRLQVTSPNTAKLTLKSRFIGTISYDTSVIAEGVWVAAAHGTTGAPKVFNLPREAIDQLIVTAKLRAYDSGQRKQRRTT